MILFSLVPILLLSFID